MNQLDHRTQTDLATPLGMGVEPSLHSVEFSVLLEGLRQRYERPLAEREIGFVVDALSNPRMIGNAELLPQTTAALIEAALAKCSSGCTIAVSAAGQRDDVQIEVADNGVRTRLNPFSRESCKSSSNDHDLTFVRLVTQWHRGRVLFDRRTACGCTEQYDCRKEH